MGSIGHAPSLGRGCVQVIPCLENLPNGGVTALWVHYDVGPISGAGWIAGSHAIHEGLHDGIGFRGTWIAIQPLGGGDVLKEPYTQADPRDATGMAQAPVKAQPPGGVLFAVCGEGRQRCQVVRPGDHVG